MAVVFLSPVGGAASQFFDNNGVPLSGGKLYSYLAGTTTPATTYTTYAGSTARTNPIVLDSAGRVPDGGEVWIIAQSYKFVLKDSDDVTIATWDNVVGGNALIPTNYTGDGSTTAYAVQGSVVDVYINGVYQNRNTYSVSGGTLTFTGIPPYNSVIEILTN